MATLKINGENRTFDAPGDMPLLWVLRLIVFLVITGSVWMIANLNSNMMPMPAQ